MPMSKEPAMLRLWRATGSGAAEALQGQPGRWINTDVSAKDTSAVVELRPKFASAAEAQDVYLVLSVRPNAAGSFPTDCVVSVSGSYATTDAELMQENAKDVVLREWSLDRAQTLQSPDEAHELELPLRAVINIAGLVAPPKASADPLSCRIFVGLRFIGCVDGTGKHDMRSAALSYLVSSSVGTADDDDVLQVSAATMEPSIHVSHAPSTAAAGFARHAPAPAADDSVEIVVNIDDEPPVPLQGGQEANAALALYQRHVASRRSVSRSPEPPMPFNMRDQHDDGAKPALVSHREYYADRSGYSDFSHNVTAASQNPHHSTGSRGDRSGSHGGSASRASQPGAGAAAGGGIVWDEHLFNDKSPSVVSYGFRGTSRSPSAGGVTPSVAANFYGRNDRSTATVLEGEAPSVAPTPSIVKPSDRWMNRHHEDDFAASRRPRQRVGVQQAQPAPEVVDVPASSEDACLVIHMNRTPGRPVGGAQRPPGRDTPDDDGGTTHRDSPAPADDVVGLSPAPGVSFGGRTPRQRQRATVHGPAIATPSEAERTVDFEDVTAASGFESVALTPIDRHQEVPTAGGNLSSAHGGSPGADGSRADLLMDEDEADEEHLHQHYRGDDEHQQHHQHREYPARPRTSGVQSPAMSDDDGADDYHRRDRHHDAPCPAPYDLPLEQQSGMRQAHEDEESSPLPTVGKFAVGRAAALPGLISRVEGKSTTARKRQPVNDQQQQQPPPMPSSQQAIPVWTEVPWADGDTNDNHEMADNETAAMQTINASSPPADSEERSPQPSEPVVGHYPQQQQQQAPTTAVRPLERQPAWMRPRSQEPRAASSPEAVPAAFPQSSSAAHDPRDVAATEWSTNGCVESRPPSTGQHSRPSSAPSLSLPQPPPARTSTSRDAGVVQPARTGSSDPLAMAMTQQEPSGFSSVVSGRATSTERAVHALRSDLQSQEPLRGVRTSGSLVPPRTGFTAVSRPEQERAREARYSDPLLSDHIHRGLRSDEVFQEQRLSRGRAAGTSNDAEGLPPPPPLTKLPRSASGSRLSKLFDDVRSVVGEFAPKAPKQAQAAAAATPADALRAARHSRPSTPVPTLTAAAVPSVSTLTAVAANGLLQTAPPSRDASVERRSTTAEVSAPEVRPVTTPSSSRPPRFSVAGQRVQNGPVPMASETPVVDTVSSTRRPIPAPPARPAGTPTVAASSNAAPVAALGPIDGNANFTKVDATTPSSRQNPTANASMAATPAASLSSASAVTWCLKHHRSRSSTGRRIVSLVPMPQGRGKGCLLSLMRLDGTMWEAAADSAIRDAQTNGCALRPGQVTVLVGLRAFTVGSATGGGLHGAKVSDPERCLVIKERGKAADGSEDALVLAVEVGTQEGFEEVVALLRRHVGVDDGRFAAH